MPFLNLHGCFRTKKKGWVRYTHISGRIQDGCQAENVWICHLLEVTVHLKWPCLLHWHGHFRASNGCWMQYSHISAKFKLADGPKLRECGTCLRFLVIQRSHVCHMPFSGTEIEAAQADWGGIISIRAKLNILGTTRLAAPHYELSVSFKIVHIPYYSFWSTYI